MERPLCPNECALISDRTNHTRKARLESITRRPKNNTVTIENHKYCKVCDEVFLIINNDNFGIVKQYADDVLGGWIKEIRNEMTQVVIQSDFFEVKILPRDLKNSKHWDNNNWKQKIEECIVSEEHLVNSIKKRIRNLEIDRSMSEIATVLFFEDSQGNTNWSDQELDTLEDIYNYSDEELKAHCLE